MTMAQAILSVRFGMGRSPYMHDPDDAGVLLDRLSGPDDMAARYPVPRFESVYPAAAEIRQLFRDYRQRNDEDARKAGLRLRRRLHAEHRRLDRVALARALDTADGLRERLALFWADHFTVIGKGGIFRHAVPLYVEEAIRPHVAGRFADMLRAVATHPMMLFYLDQAASVGPGSEFARRRPGRGLNENLARELLELHTLGVDGAYTQADVRQLAELLAGLTATAAGGTRFDPRRGEPGAEAVLGRRYGGALPMVRDIHGALEDLAVHPDTARHVCRKLCAHFVADAPDDQLVEHVTARYAATGGDLAAVYAALLEHPAATAAPLTKARQPWDFVAAGLRALGMQGERMAATPARPMRRFVRGPLRRMGQDWLRPTGPDGWPEEAAHWFTPQGLAGRIGWAMAVGEMPGLPLPDPRLFVETALGPLASERTRFAARAAETRAEGVGLVLLSPQFQRR